MSAWTKFVVWLEVTLIKLRRKFKVIPLLAGSMLALVCLAGCGKTFYTHVDGEQDMIGVKLPVESDIQLDIVHHVNGTTMTVKDKSSIVHDYSVTNSNNYLGIVHIYEQRKGSIRVYPCMTNKVEVVK